MIINPYRYAASSTLLDDLVSWWRMEETSGTRYDAHGSHDLSDSNSVGYTSSGKVDNAAHFATFYSESLNLSDHADFTPSGSFTVAFWTYIIYSTGLTNDYWISKYYTTGNQRSWSCQSSSRVPRILASSDGSSYTSCPWGSALSFNTWYFFVAYYDDDNNELGISINDGTFATTAFTGPVYNNTAQLQVGDRYVSSEFNGYMDEVAFWNRMLTASEVTELYNSGNGITYPG